MTVRELLIQLIPTLLTHEVNTLCTYPTSLMIDIEHNHYFHSVGVYDNDDFKCHNSQYRILRSFESSIYKQNEKEMYSVLDDFEVYRWSITKDKDERIWTLGIETKQT